MTHRYFPIFLALLPVLIGCEAAELLSEAEPSFTAVDGPTGSKNDLDFKGTAASANVTVFPDARISLRRASSEGELRSPDAVDIEPTCTAQGSVRSCSGVVAPTAIEAGQPVLSVGDTVFYQWFIEYGEAGGVAESPVRSFSVETANSCAFADVGPVLGTGDCSADRICSVVGVSILGTPGAETVPRCHIPAP